MIRLSLALAVLAAAALPSVAAAKEPSQASISGPGLKKTLAMREGVEYTSTPIGRLTTDSGFFPSVVDQSPDPMLAGRPAGRLGPKYTIVWTVPADTTTRVKQDVYPYASGGAVAYTRPGQPIFDGVTTGGWFRGGAPLKQTLVRLGLPARERQASGGANLALIAGLGIPGALATAAAVAFGYRRRTAR
jgi:hypothetical protein